MRSWYTTVLAAALLALLAAPAFAQPGGGARGPGGRGVMGGGAFLLQNKGVREELKLTKEQGEQLRKAAEEVRDKYKDDLAKAREDKDQEKFRELMQKQNEETNKAVSKVLDPKQTKRFKEIQLQVGLQFMGPGVFLRPDVEKGLKLTDKQKEEIKETSEELNKDRRELFKDALGDPDKMADARKKSQELSNKAVAKVTSSMTDEQKKAWKEMTGTHFEFKFEGFGPGGRPGGRRPGGRPEPKKDN